MRYRHPARRLRDPHGQLARILAEFGSGARRLPPKELGRLGGEMARRMVEAALAYLTEHAVEKTRASFAAAAFARRDTPDGDVTSRGPKA